MAQLGGESEAKFTRAPGGTLGSVGIRLETRSAIAIEIGQFARGQRMAGIGSQAPPARGVGGIRCLAGVTSQAQHAQLVGGLAITSLSRLAQ
ncbi:hypothetical protein D3C77_699930 [compost metagenome]